MKNRISIIGCIIWIVSFFLPFIKVADVKTYSLKSELGIQWIGQNWIYYLVLVVFIVWFVLASRLNNKAAIVAISFAFLYFVMLNGSLFKNLAKAGTQALSFYEVGLYINFVVGVALGIYLIHQELKKN